MRLRGGGGGGGSVLFQDEGGGCLSEIFISSTTFWPIKNIKISAFQNLMFGINCWYVEKQDYWKYVSNLKKEWLAHLPLCHTRITPMLIRLSPCTRCKWRIISTIKQLSLPNENGVNRFNPVQKAVLWANTCNFWTFGWTHCPICQFEITKIIPLRKYPMSFSKDQQEIWYSPFHISCIYFVSFSLFNFNLNY